MSFLLIMLRSMFRPSSALADIGFALLVAPPLYCGVWVLLPTGKQKLIEYLSYLLLFFESIRDPQQKEGVTWAPNRRKS